MNKLITLVSLAVLAPLPGSLARAGVLSHWTFDEPAGAVAADSAGGIDGTLLGGATFAPSAGIAGGAVSLDHTTDGVVDFGSVYPFTGAVDRTVSLWIRTDDTSIDAVAIGRHTAGSRNGYFLVLNTTFCYGAAGRATAYASTPCGQEPTSTTTVTDDAWHHVAMTYESGGDVTILVDGVAEDLGPATNVVSNEAGLLVGGVFFDGVPSGLFTGLVDDVQLYDFAATETQVRWLFEHPGETLPSCAPDLDDNGSVGFSDLSALLNAWGPCDAECPEDISGNGQVGFADLSALLAAWGACSG